MKLPTHLFIDGILPKKIYYFVSDKISSDAPHYFICLSKADGGMVLLSCCTTQFEKRKKFIEDRDFPHTTLVWIKPDEKNELKEDTYVDCNSCFSYTIEELGSLYESEKLHYKGELSDSHFEQILIGLRDSPLIDEVTKEALNKYRE